MESLIFIIITALITIVSIGFCLLSVFRIHTYIQAYRFERHQYRPLLGFIHLRMMIWAYIVSTVITSGLLVIYLIILKI